MSESEAYTFQKLSEVELLEKAPRDANSLVEVDGKIKRVSGGVGGGVPVVFINTMSSDGDAAPLTAEEAAALDECVEADQCAIVVVQTIPDVAELSCLCTRMQTDGVIAYAGLNLLLGVLIQVGNNGEGWFIQQGSMEAASL